MGISRKIDGFKKCSVLIVDDDDDIRTIISETLEDSIKTIFSLEDPIQALEYLKNNEVDLIITDKNMPQMDGFTLIEKIREINSYLHIVMITGYSDIESYQKALKLRVFDLIEKPFRPEDITNRIHNALMNHNYQLALEQLATRMVLLKYDMISREKFASFSKADQYDLIRELLSTYSE